MSKQEQPTEKPGTGPSPAHAERPPAARAAEPAVAPAAPATAPASAKPVAAPQPPASTPVAAAPSATAKTADAAPPPPPPAPAAPVAAPSEAPAEKAAPAPSAAPKEAAAQAILQLPAAAVIETSSDAAPAVADAAAPIAAEEHAAHHPKTHKDESARGRGPRLFRIPGVALHSRSIVIENVAPQLDDGRYPVKREVGDTLDVSATIFREGHDLLKAVLLYRRKDETAWRQAPLEQVNYGLALWQGSIVLYENARYVYTVEAWTDVFGSWCSEVEKKLAANQNVDLELLEGRELVEEVLTRAQGEDAAYFKAVLEAFDGGDTGARTTLLLGPHLRAAMERWPDLNTVIRYDHELEVVVDRVRARFAAWYEMFHRSQGKIPGRSATFADCEARLPDIKAMGFDVIYFVPIHPIGRTFRKGRNNTLAAQAGDPGSPYAIGSEEGGHTAVHPDLGTLDDFRRFVAACHDQDMEVALDFAIQCSPDHPWIKEHPEWFLFRPDGSIKYAENPPKKYQDIVNVDFYCEAWWELWTELKSVIEFWVEQGVKIFRVDNPHTKPVPFWEWMIDDVQSKHPDVVFLSEAFTRPPMLKMLAKVGFTQSYTYFTWRHTKAELTEYLTELTQTPVKEYLRPNFFANTPDINPPYLQTGGRPAHQIRLILAATLSTVYGIYNGFELCEATPIPGKEEYLNSEKFEYKVWDWGRPGNIKDYIARVNQIRRDNPALRELDNLRFYTSSDDNILFYGKMTPDRSNMVFVVVNLDPFATHDADITFPLKDMGLLPTDLFVAEEMLSNRRLEWRGAKHWVRLDPYLNPCEIFRITPLREGGWR